MKVILDVNAIKQPLTGVGRYALRLAQGLRRNESIEAVKFFTSEGWLEDIDSLETNISFKNDPTRKIKLVLEEKVPFKGLVRKGHQYYTNCRFKQLSQKLTDYIYHGPNYQLMPFSGKSVVTVHDLSFIRHPEFHPKQRARFWAKEIHKVVERADHLITDSEFQRQEIIEILGIAENRVSAVHLGVEAKFKDYSKKDCKEILSKHGLRFKEYSLVVATIEPRKNFIRLLKAFQNLPAGLRKTYPLAIVGDKGWLSDEVHLNVSQLVEKNEAVRLGYVDESDLPYLYSASSAFLYPSLYEGFGLPVLEAMASGTAVLTSNLSSIPEVAGDACMLIDPFSVDSITEEWGRLLESDELRKVYAEKGREQAQHFSWQKCIQNTVNIYSKLS